MGCDNADGMSKRVESAEGCSETWNGCCFWKEMVKGLDFASNVY